MEPGIEPVRVAQTRKVTPGSDVHLLDGVSREIGVPEDEAGDRAQLRDGAVDELGEGVMIAPTCSFDDFPLVHGHPRDASVRPRSRVLASRAAEPFPIHPAASILRRACAVRARVAWARPGAAAAVAATQTDNFRATRRHYS